MNNYYHQIMSKELELSKVLFDACNDNNINSVKLLLNEENGITHNLDIVNSYGNTVLMVAIRCKYDIIVSIILNYKKYNVDLHIKNCVGFTALIYASMSGNVKIVQMLLNYEREGLFIDPNTQDMFMKTALIWAIGSKSVEVVKLLLNYKKIPININLADSCGDTPLIHASSKNCLEIVNLLLGYGIKYNIDINHKNYHKLSALDIANKNGYEQIKNAINTYIESTLFYQ